MNKFSKILCLALFGLFMTTGLSAQQNARQTTKQILSKECAQAFKTHIKDGQTIKFITDSNDATPGQNVASKVKFLPDGRVEFNNQASSARVNGATFYIKYNDASHVLTIYSDRKQEIVKYKVSAKGGGENEIQCM